MAPRSAAECVAVSWSDVIDDELTDSSGSSESPGCRTTSKRNVGLFEGAGRQALLQQQRGAYSRDRRGEHPQAHLAGYAGILQADAYDGYNKLYLADRKPGPIREVACWVHARRAFFAMADIEENARRKAAGKKEIPLSPIAIEVVRRIDALFAIERSINGKSPEERLAVRRTVSRPLVDALMTYMRERAAKSKIADQQAINSSRSTQYASSSMAMKTQRRRVAVKSFPSKTVRKNYQRIEGQKQPFSELLVVSHFEN